MQGTPLCWAVVSGAASAITSVDGLKGKTFAISRLGSGSHLMACVLAVQRGWNPAKDLKFVVAGDFKSLRDAVNSGLADAFMWETFTTKPYWDSGELRRVGDITTPWPCFMLAGVLYAVFVIRILIYLLLCAFLYKHLFLLSPRE